MDGLPEQDVALVRRWCDERVPQSVRNQVRIECHEAPRHLTVVERRPPWRGETGQEWTTAPVARLRYTKKTGTWTLYYRDQNLHFRRYDLTPSSDRVSALLDEIGRDPTGIFWG